MSHKNRGLTLVEVLVVLTIMSILGVMLYTVFKSGSDAWTKSEVRLDIYQNARMVLDQMSRELAGAFISADDNIFEGIDGEPSDPMVNGSPDELTFLTNFGDSVYKIYYRLDTVNHNLMRGYIQNPTDYTYTSYTTVDLGSDKITHVNFQYYPDPGNPANWTADGTWNTTDTLPELVKIEIKLKENPDDVTDTEYTFETYVYLPNSE